TPVLKTVRNLPLLDALLNAVNRQHSVCSTGDEFRIRSEKLGALVEYPRHSAIFFKVFHHKTFIELASVSGKVGCSKWFTCRTQFYQRLSRQSSGSHCQIRSLSVYCINKHAAITNYHPAIAPYLRYRVVAPLRNQMRGVFFHFAPGNQRLN